MAVFEAYGAWTAQTSSGNRMQLYARADVSYPAADHARVRVQIQVGTRYPVSDRTNSFSAWGDAGMPSESGSRPFTHSGSGQWTTIYDRSFDVTRDWGSSKRLALAATFSGVTATPGQARVDLTYTVEGRPYSAPAAPTSLTATRVSDTHQSLAFSSTSTTGAPRTSFTLQRAAYGGDWVTIASPTSSPYADKTTTANRRYDYRVRANGPGGSSAWYRPNGGVGDVSTTPAQPSSVTAAKNASGDIVVMWAGTWYYPTGYLTFDVEESANGGITWTSRATGLGAATRSWTHASPDPASPHMYRVRARTAGPTLSGPWRNSNTVQLLAPPNAPANLKATQSAPGYRPATSQVVDAAEAVTLAWTHASVDTTPQSAYSLRWRLTGATAWTTVAKTTSATSSRAFPAGTWEPGAVVEWQVQTWGGHADPSPWSATATFTAAARPTVAISAPGEEIDTSRATAAWAYYQEAGRPQSQWTLTLTRDGQQVESRSGSGTTDSLALTSTLADGATYALTVEVLSADGLWSAPDTLTFAVAYASPPPAAVTGVFDPEQGAMVLSIDTPAPDEGEPPAVSVDLYRRINGAEWEQIATNLPPTTTILDHTCITHGLNEYRADSVSALPSTREGEAVGIRVDETTWAYVTTADGHLLRWMSGLTVSSRPGRQKVRHEFFGRRDPVVYAGHQQALALEIGGDLLDETTTWQEVEEMAQIDGVVLYRDGDGRRVWADMDGVTITRDPSGLFWRFSATLTRVEADGA